MAVISRGPTAKELSARGSLVQAEKTSHLIFGSRVSQRVFFCLFYLVFYLNLSC